ncbi:MAG: caspase family protein [Planctomycetia bacterium]|nr:caspase family protein [Planctomycetia bacterium]
MRNFVRFVMCVGLMVSAGAQIGSAAEEDIIIKKPAAKKVPLDLDAVPGRRYGLLVGVNDYTYFSDLAYCNDDIGSLSDALQKSGFDARDLTVLRDGLTDHHLLPFRNNILTQLKNLLESVRTNDLVIVAFSGHGVHLAGKSYLCPTDSQLDRAGETMIPLDTLYEMLQGCQASQKLLIVDACRNDPTPSGTRSPAGIDQTNEFTRSLQQQQPPRGTMLFNSCAPNQYSVEDPDFKSGVFMHYLIAGLRGEADADKDAKVSLFELYRYAEYETKTYVRRTRNLVQTPVLKGEVTGVYELAVVSEKSAELPKADPLANTAKQATVIPSTTVPNNTVPAAVAFGLEKPAVADTALTKSVIDEHPLLKQGNRYFAEGKYPEAIDTFTNAIKVEENKTVIREAFKRRSAAYMAADPSANVMKALSDSQAAGLPSLTAQIRGNDAKLMDASRVVATLKSGQFVQISSVNTVWLQVVSVDGNDSIIGWLEMKNLGEQKEQIVVAPQTVRPTYPQYPQYPQNSNGGNRPLSPRPNGGGVGGGIIRGLEREMIRQILK